MQDLNEVANDISSVIDQLIYTKTSLKHSDEIEFNIGVLDGQIERLMEVRKDLRDIQDTLMDVHGSVIEKYK